MESSLVILKIKERVNKIDSSDYDNLECWQVREAYNKAQLEWVRRRIEGLNQLQEGDEETKNTVSDLQVILKPVVLKGKNHPEYFETEEIPNDFLSIKRVTPIVTNECGTIPFKSFLREEENVDDYLADWCMRPAPEMEETFHTMIGNRVRVYTNGDFKVEKVNFIYYRYPRKLDIGNCEQIDGKSGQSISPELKDDVVELIIDDAASILAGDIESINQVQITKQRSNTNT